MILKTEGKVSSRFIAPKSHIWLLSDTTTLILEYGSYRNAVPSLLLSSYDYVANAVVIWDGNEDGSFRTVVFIKNFNVAKAPLWCKLTIWVDDRVDIYINDVFLDTFAPFGIRWNTNKKYDITDKVVIGANKLRFDVANAGGGAAGLLFFGDVAID